MTIRWGSRREARLGRGHAALSPMARPWAVLVLPVVLAYSPGCTARVRLRRRFGTAGRHRGSVGHIAVKQRSLTLELLSDTFAVARLEPDSSTSAWAEAGALVSVTRTRAELSIVCEDASVPVEARAQRGFRCLRVLGPLDFAETGILESLADPLARAGISIFALSTYDTDYLLMPGDDLEAALSALSEAGHAVRRPDAA